MRLSPLLCGRTPEAGFIEEGSGFLASHSKDQPRAAYLHALPESLIERIFPSLPPVAGLIASRDLMLAAPRGGFPKLAGFVAPATIFYARALHPLTEPDVCFPGRTVPKPSRNGFRRML